MILFHFKGPKEYCSTEKFAVTCDDNEVIMIHSAIYGRMQPGRCISGRLFIQIYGISLKN